MGRLRRRGASCALGLEMGRQLGVFFNSEMPLDGVASKLEKALMLQPFQRGGEDEVLYSGLTIGLFVMLVDDHRLENDLGIPFEEYEFHLSIELMKRCGSMDANEAHLLSASMYVFHMVAETVGGKAILVDDLERLLLTV